MDSLGRIIVSDLHRMTANELVDLVSAAMATRGLLTHPNATHIRCLLTLLKVRCYCLLLERCTKV